MTGPVVLVIIFRATVELADAFVTETVTLLIPVLNGTVAVIFLMAKTELLVIPVLYGSKTEENAVPLYLEVELPYIPDVVVALEVEPELRV